MTPTESWHRRLRKLSLSFFLELELRKMNVPIQHNHVYPRDFSLLSGLYIYFTTIFQINSSISEIKSFRSLFPLHHCQIRCIALYPTLAISTCYRWAWTTISTFFDPRNSQVKQLTFRLHIIVLSKKRFQGTSSNPLWLLPIETASKIAYKHHPDYTEWHLHSQPRPWQDQRILFLDSQPWLEKFLKTGRFLSSMHSE